jgi:hypothetical protein
MSPYVLDHHLEGEKKRLALMSQLLDPMHRRYIESLEDSANQTARCHRRRRNASEAAAGLSKPGEDTVNLRRGVGTKVLWLRRAVLGK